MSIQTQIYRAHFVSQLNLSLKWLDWINLGKSLHPDVNEGIMTQYLWMGISSNTQYKSQRAFMDGGRTARSLTRSRSNVALRRGMILRVAVLNYI
jgi:hypothetical protein